MPQKNTGPAEEKTGKPEYVNFGETKTDCERYSGCAQIPFPPHIRLAGECLPISVSPHRQQHEGCTLVDYVAAHEKEDIFDYLAEVWEQMQQSIPF